MTQQDGQNNPPHQDSKSTSPERTPATRGGGRHNHSEMPSGNRTQEIEAGSYTADQYDENSAEDSDFILPESPSSIQHDGMDEQSVAPSTQSQQEAETTPYGSDQEGAGNHHPVEGSDCADSEMSYHQTTDQVGNDVNTAAVVYGPERPPVPVHSRARERRPESTPSESRRKETAVLNDSEQMSWKMEQQRNPKQRSSRQAKAEENDPYDAQTTAQKHIAYMQADPVKYYQHFKNTVERLEGDSNRWEARFNALSKEMLSGRDRYQPATDGHLQNEMTQLRERVRTLAKTVTRSVRDIKEGEFRGALKVGTVPGPPDSCPPPSQASERWKSLTGFRLHEKFGKEVPGCRHAGVVLQRLLVPLCGHAINDLKEGLDGVLGVTARLATVMCQQRSRLELFIPEISEDGCPEGKAQDFDSEGPVEDGTALFVVVPCLRKWGNGFGANLEQCEDLEAAQVKCTDAEI
ncbi:hypothetical protein GP486_001848 [Trichoglossum hirsutum]|uniref:Uncharacterized protein n=1 Tax=Trichoglossum hirsutum TaxID=265104 RepID=A0A9P8RS92_9PEZI|nr:hypothetical protein GP486_001848 [Trichoglossum hirsutum]